MGISMAAQEPSKILDDKLRALAEDFEFKSGEAHNRIVESLEGRVESLIEKFGTTAVGDRMKRYPITTPGGTLFAIFRPMVSEGNFVEETWEVDEEL